MSEAEDNPPQLTEEEKGILDDLLGNVAAHIERDKALIQDIGAALSSAPKEKV